VINEEVTAQQIEEIARFLTQEFKKSRDFNSFVMEFWDHDVFMNSGGSVSLGIVTYAPKGGMASDLDFDAGNYSTHQFDFNTWEKDWAARPSNEEIEIFGRVLNRFDTTDPDVILANTT
jgi:hypothetical protein